MLRLLFALLIVVCSSACSTTPALRDLEHPTPANEPITEAPQPPAQTWRYAQPPTTAAPLMDRDDAEARLPPTTAPAPVPGPSKKYKEDAAPMAESGAGEAARGMGSAPSADMKSAQPSESMRRPAPVQPDRPGLGTTWGEHRDSQVTEVPFQRASQSPTFAASLWYNDRQGAEDMARYGSGYAAMDRATIYLARGLSVSLRDEWGSALPGFRAGGKVYAVGEHNRRYAIVIENRTATRFEVVASVDGLDVLDGRSASYNKRGYIVEAYGRLEIEGFRQSDSAVAAFRFGSVRNSYAKQMTGSDRNVGVIGVALFAERAHLPYWSYHELDRRQQADPFPSKWAPQPTPPPQPYPLYQAY